MIFNISEVEEIIGYSFKDKMLLRKCFTHSSYANEHKTDDNELLEFFGDSIIQLVVTEYLFKSVAGDEGELTEIRKDIVSKEPLLRAIKKLKLCDYILLGSGIKNKSSQTEKLYSSLYEALVAGIYLDGGAECAKLFIERTIICDYKKEKKAKKPTCQIKSQFQEYVQKRKLGSISYEFLNKKGPDNLPEFRMVALLNGKPLAEGVGKTKKQAESVAAEKALKTLMEQGGK